MGTPALNPRTDLAWTSGSSAAEGSYLAAVLRAAVIAAVLLGVLALVVLF